MGLQDGNIITADSPKLDFLRSVAISLVVGAHLFLFFGNPVYLKYFEPGLLGTLGVVLFFVHTSLVLMMSLERQTEKSHQKHWLRNFYIRRAFRIYPLSVLCVLLIYFFNVPATNLHTDSLTNVQGIDFFELLANIGLFHNFLKDATILGPLWSLPYEMQMYLLLPFFFLFTRKKWASQGLLFLWSIFICTAFVFSPFISKINLKLDYWQIPHFLYYFSCFIPGIISYQAHKENQARLPFWSFVLILMGIIFLWLLSYDRNKYYLLSFVAAISLSFIKEPKNKYLILLCKMIAKYSYGFYLFHIPSIWLAFIYFSEFPLIIQSLTFVISLVGLSVLGFHLIEKPFIQMGNSLAGKIS